MVKVGSGLVTAARPGARRPAHRRARRRHRRAGPRPARGHAGLVGRHRHGHGEARARAPAALDPREAGGGRGRTVRPDVAVRAGVREARAHGRAGAPHRAGHQRPLALPERPQHAADAARPGRACPSSTRTTRWPSTRSRSATTTTSPPSWPTSSTPTWSCSSPTWTGCTPPIPAATPTARRLDTVEAVTGDIQRLVYDESSNVSVGGMATKLEAAARRRPPRASRW